MQTANQIRQPITAQQAPPFSKNCAPNSQLKCGEVMTLPQRLQQAIVCIFCASNVGVTASGQEMERCILDSTSLPSATIEQRSSGAPMMQPPRRINPDHHTMEKMRRAHHPQKRKSRRDTRSSMEKKWTTSELEQEKDVERRDHNIKVIRGSRYHRRSPRARMNTHQIRHGRS